MDAAMRRSRIWIVFGFALLLLAGAFTGYWVWLDSQVMHSVEDWIAARRAEGYRVGFESIRKAGFPFRAEVRLTAPAVAHADQGFAWNWQSRELIVSAPLHRFDRLTLIAPGPSRMEIAPQAARARAAAGPDTTIFTREARTELGYGPEGIASIRSTSQDIVIAQKDAGGPLKVGTLVLEAEAGRQGAPGGARDLAIRAKDIQVAGLADSPLGGEIAVLGATGTLQGPFPQAPLRAAIAGWRDEGGVLDLSTLQVVWGAVRLKGSGTLALDETLRPIGAFALRVAGYNWLLNQFVARQQLNPSDAELARAMLAALAQQQGNGDGVPIPVRIQNGRVWLGPKAIAQVAPIL